jgi:hypothetical protein
MLKAIRVSAMLLALAGSTYAGEMLTPPAPQPPPASTAQEPVAQTTIQESVTQPTTEDATQVGVTEIALDLLTLLRSLF